MVDTGPSVLADFAQHEISVAGDNGDVETRELSAHPIPPFGVFGDAMRHPGTVANRRFTRRERKRVDIERPAHSVQNLHHMSGRMAPTEPEGAQPMDFREGAEHRHIIPVPDKPDAAVVTRDEFRIGAVDDQQGLRWKRIGKALKIFHADHRAGGVVRIGDEDQPCAARQRRDHRVNVRGQAPLRRRNRGRPSRHGRNRIHQKPVPGVQDFVAGTGIGLAEQGDDFIRPRSADDSIRCNSVDLSDGLAQWAVIAIRVEVQGLRRFARGFLRHLARSVRIFVRTESEYWRGILVFGGAGRIRRNVEYAGTWRDGWMSGHCGPHIFRSPASTRSQRGGEARQGVVAFGPKAPDGFSLIFGLDCGRIVFDPSDHFGIDRIPDSALGHRIPAGVGGHDANGFHNLEVPETVDILAVGDSMTYGWMASSADSWPVVLSKITGKSVYNAGMGAYGPLQYLHLIRTLAPKLEPERVVVMVFPANDPFDAYNLAYFLEHWKSWRNPARDGDADPFLHPLRWGTEDAPPQRWSEDWFAGYATLWHLFKRQSGLFHKLRTLHHPVSDWSISVTHLNSTFQFWIGTSEFRGVAADDPKIVEGMSITKRVLGEIAVFCAERNIDLHVALMPACAQVLYPFIEDQLTDAQDKRMTTFTGRLQSVTAELIDFLSAEGISHTRLYEPMVRTSETQVIYTGADGHPNGTGYRVVAETLAEALAETP